MEIHVCFLVVLTFNAMFYLQTFEAALFLEIELLEISSLSSVHMAIHMHNQIVNIF